MMKNHEVPPLFIALMKSEQGVIVDKIETIIAALQFASDNSDKTNFEYHIIEKALAAARELKDELYVKEMEQPTPKQSGVMSITVSKVCEAGALPPTANAVYWMDMVVANLVRNGVNKHRAKELAHHFYTYTTPLYALDEVKHD